MPPKKSRRLPGGKVRRPGGRPPTAAALARPGRLAEPKDLEGEESLDELDEADVQESTAVSLEEFRVTPPAAPAPVVSTPRRARERSRPRAGVRTGPTSMDLAARNYSHIRGDLIRIAIIALVMFGIIVALSFVLK